MNDILDRYHFLKSRKFWAAFAGWIALLISCLQTEPFPVETFVNGTVAIALGYIGGVAFEDGMAKRQSGPVQVAQADNVNIEDNKL
jgi:hypothetical protein